MKKKILNKYIFFILLIILIIMLGILIYIRFFSNNGAKEYSILKEKGEGEIIYLDSNIIEIMNKLNNISYERYEVIVKQINEGEQQSDSKSNNNNSSQQENKSSSPTSDTSSATQITDESDNRASRLSPTDSLLSNDYENISWNEISYKVETLYTAWPAINLDMKALNVSDEDINKFSITLDGIAQSVKSQDKNNSLINLYNLYILLPKFLSYFESSKSKLNLYYTKAELLNTYVLASTDKWKDMNNSINASINTLKEVINENTILESEKSSFEKALVLLEEVKKGISLEDKSIFYLKYEFAMEQLEIL